ncbi:kinesin-like protein KIN-7D, mitochondrial [Aristolochia californica]|uniref:kinesin-like protein KIN-7D, mitochondrial n=1 Tax=Aristolochia californica TaxID=171875 RepID=UPI0035DEB3D2
MASSSRGRSSSPFGYRKPSSSYSSTSSSSMNGKLIPRSSSSSASSQFYSSGNGFVPRSITPSRGRNDIGSYGKAPRAPVGFAEPLVLEPVEGSRAGDSISVTIRFRPMSEREFQRGDEITWYPDGDKVVRCEYNPATAYAFDRVFGPSTASKAVYDVAARPVVKAAMEGVNGTVFAYGVTSSGKTHTMHGDQNSPGIIPLAIKDVFSIIQDTPGSEFLLRVSYLEIYNEVINDLLDPTGQNLRVREDAHGTYVEGIKEEVVLSPGHALSFIAAGEEHRHVGSNNFNLLSSRSHTIFTLMIESSAHGDEYDGVIFSQLNLIDLAGSESSKTETTGLRRKEGAYINKSLLTLGTVIGKLSEGKASHVPYRDSKLTRLLQSSLSGHGHVSLICTVTPASSSMEETHNTLKFASRAKRVEIYASRNKIIDEKSLIKKYQSEISSLKLELEQLKKGMVAGVNHEEILCLKQKLEEGQVKMRSRLEEEEEAKAALMSRIQKLTKLILVSTKNSIPGVLGDVPGHHRRYSLGEDEKLDQLREGSPLLLEGENKDSQSSILPGSSNLGYDIKHQRSSSRMSEDSSSLTDSTQAGELISGTTGSARMSVGGITMSDQMDLLVEQVKMLAGEIAFSTSSLKRLLEQSVNDPEGSRTQIQKLESEIQEKRRQMRALEQRIMETGEASMSNASLVDMQQTVMRLMTQCNEKNFELEIKTADNRVLQEQLQNKCAENNELEEKVLLLQQQMAAVIGDKSTFSSEQSVSDEYKDELKRKIQSQEVVNEKLKLEHVHLKEENSGLRAQNQKLAEEASYAKELASAAAVELKNLAGEVTKLSLQNERQAKELLAVQEVAYSRGIHPQAGNGGLRKYSESKNDGFKNGRKGRLTSRGNDGPASVYDGGEYWNLDPDDLRMELQARKQREAVLEAALAEKELAEEEYRRNVEEAKIREAALENDLASMWVLVAKLKKGDRAAVTPSNAQDKASYAVDLVSDPKLSNVEDKDTSVKERQLSDESERATHDELNQSTGLEPLFVRLKARVQEMKEKKLESLGNGDANSHVCKVCFEAPAAVVLIPCRHFCLCKPCSLACSECPLCRQKIEDRIITFTS